jgi:hypothetical protein
MRREKSFSWQYAIQGVLEYANPCAVQYVEPAFYGDPEAVRYLTVALSKADSHFLPASW